MRVPGVVLASLGSVIALVVGAGCGGAVGAVPVTPDLVERARASWPAANQQGLEHGRTTLLERCGACHNVPDPAAKGVAEWPGTLDDMAKRASLSQPERDDLQHYLLAVHP